VGLDASSGERGHNRKSFTWLAVKAVDDAHIERSLQLLRCCIVQRGGNTMRERGPP
jgi:hypothetical protein